VKTKLCAAALGMSGCVMMMFAAKDDPCAEKYKTCTDSCMNAKAQARARQVDEAQYENAYKMCVQDCDKKKEDCGGKPKKP
jgi:hypothetical protein